MDFSVLQDAGFDTDAALRRCAGDEDLYAQVLGMFVQDENVKQAAQCLESGDRDGFFGHVHEVKGMCGNLGITPLYEAASQVIVSLRADADDEARRLFGDVESLRDKAVRAIGKAGV